MTTDPRNETERLLNEAMDHIAGTHEQPRDMRAWDHLLVYCPKDRLDAELLRRENKVNDNQLHEYVPSKHGQFCEVCGYAKSERLQHFL